MSVVAPAQQSHRRHGKRGLDTEGSGTENFNFRCGSAATSPECRLLQLTNNAMQCTALHLHRLCNLCELREALCVSVCALSCHRSNSPSAKARRVLSGARCGPQANFAQQQPAHVVGATTIAALHSLFPAMNERVPCCWIHSLHASCHIIGCLSQFTNPCRRIMQ